MSMHASIYVVIFVSLGLSALASHESRLPVTRRESRSFY